MPTDHFLSSPQRKAGWKRVILVAVVALLSSTAAADDGTSRPNILFIFSDDHATDAIGAYGGRLAELNPTPNIDRLAASGVLFRRSFCTNSICGPSRAVILTGKHSHINGFCKNSQRFNPNQPTFPAALQAAGYRTAIIGKWHLGCDPVGFDSWTLLPGQGEYYNPRFRTPAGTITVEGHCSNIITDRAIDWLEGRKDDRPFLLMCQHKAPHRNWMPAPEDLTAYQDVTIPEPDSLFDDCSDNASPAGAAEMSIRDHMHSWYDLFFDGEATPAEDKSQAVDKSGVRNLDRMSAAQLKAWNEAFASTNRAFQAANPKGKDRVRLKYQRYMKNYLRAVRGVDRSVGRLLDYLDASGLADNTIVVYSSDQGFYLGEHGWYDKRWAYEPSLEMPLIVRWPGVTPRGTVVDALVQNLDYAPTFLEAAGLAIPDDIQGRSLVRLLHGDVPTGWRESIYYHYHAHPDIHNVARHQCVRTSTHKLIRFYQTDEWELYDLESDPKEMHNVYGKPAYREVQSQLHAELERLATEALDNTTTSSLRTRD